METRTRETELHTIRRGFSIDRPINFVHRSGDIEGAGASRLDLYASAESAEEVYFEGEDEKARRVFLKLFKKFLKTTYTKAEIKFLIMSASGAKPQEIRERLKIADVLKYREAIQEKGYKNAEALRAAVVCSGWSRAEEFAETIFRRVEMYHRGEKVIEELPENKRARQIAEKKRECFKRYREEHREELLEKNRRYKEEHREELREWKKRYDEANREKVLERSKRYYEANREKFLEKNRRYRKEHREEVREYFKRYRKEHRKEIRESEKRYKEEHREELREWKKRYEETHREKVKERKKRYRERNREEIAEINKRYYERKKMEKLAAKLRAKENLPAIRMEAAEAPQEIIIE